MPVGSDPRPGSEIAGFRLEQLLGRGGMGAVYRAEDVRLGRKVALKLLIPELAENERFRERFLRESQTAASLDHPHIVPIYAAGEADGQLYLAMRYVEGADLRQLIAREAPLSPERVLRIAEQVGDALDAAHERGLIHRDVKPANVLVDERSGRAHCYLTDFGLTKQTSSISGLTGTGELVGTVEYVSPEQIRGEPVDGRADLYSLGCVLYECLTGERPFARESEVATLWAHVHDAPPPLRGLGGEIDQVMAKALAKAPADRYRTCGELVREGRAALGLDAPAQRRRRSRRRRLARSRGLMALAGAVVALALIGLAAALVLGGSGGTTHVGPEAVGVIDPTTSKVVDDVPVGFTSSLIAAGEGFVWVLDPKASTLTRIDPETMKVVGPTRGIPADGIATGLAAGEGSVWVAVNEGRRLVVLEIGPDLGELRDTIPLYEAPVGTLSVLRETVVLATGDRAVWSLERGRGKVTRIDPASGAPKPLSEGHGASTAIAVGKGAVWLGGIDGVTKLDAATGTQLGSTFVNGVVNSAVTSIALGKDATWFVADDRPRLWRIAPATTSIDDSFPVGPRPAAVAVDAHGIVWVACGDGTLRRLDPRSGALDTVDIGVAPGGVLSAFGRVWTSPAPAVSSG